MHGLTKVRLAGGLVLAALMFAVAGDPPAVFGQKKAKSQPYADSSKKTTVVQPTLPEGTKLTAEQLAKHIDKLVVSKLASEKVDASSRCSDEEFLRRAYLDLTGKIPTAEKAVAFLDSKEPNKRAKLIDELLDSKDYGRHMADNWQALLLPRNSDNRRLTQSYTHLAKWLEDKFNANAGWDAMVKEFMTVTGAVEKNGPVIYWLANNSADKVTDNVGRMFLGIQLQCAQCHNHPFTDWKQDEYWGMAAFFLHVRPDGNPKAAAKNGGSINLVDSPKAKKGKKMGLPESAKILPPKFLQGERPNVKGLQAVRPVLADWMVSAKNPFFSKAMVNRMWGQLFGRGIINPVDDMHAANAASHPELLADLGQQFANNGFDVKHLLRAICNSETYQRSSKPQGNNIDVGPELFARMAIKPLTPEQMYDALTQLMGAERRAAVKNKANMRGAGNAREAFVAFFSAEDGADPTEYQTGIPQVLRLMNSPQFNNAGALGPAIRGKGPEEALETLYLTVLSRRPTSEDRQRVQNYVRKSKAEGREAIAGVLWALMNSSEFALNR